MHLTTSFHHCTGSIGFPLTIGLSLKFFFLCIKLLIDGIAPSYISDLLELKPASRYNLRSSIDTLLLKHSNFKSLSTLGDRSFKCAGPKLWNELPKDIRNATTIQFLNFSSRHIYLKKHSM